MKRVYLYRCPVCRFPGIYAPKPNYDPISPMAMCTSCGHRDREISFRTDKRRSMYPELNSINEGD